MMTNLFFDTCSLIAQAERLDEWTENYNLIISSITLKELERIKTAANKDIDVKYAARKILQFLSAHPKAITVHIYKESMLEPIQKAELEINDDAKILATAIHCEKTKYPDNMGFMTNDMSLYHIANLFFGEDSIFIPEDPPNYQGFLEVVLDNESMAKFYSNPNDNMFNLYINEYLNILNKDKEIVDTLVWTGDHYRPLKYSSLNSNYFGEIKAYKNDIYQAMLIDSFLHNKITMVKGPAGSGKTLLSLAYLLSQLEKGRIDKIIVFCNTVATKNSARLGFYPGTRDEKLLDSQIGNLLNSKIGGRVEVERMIQEEKLLLLPMSDIRGYDTSGMRAGIYISEAQNLDISLMKLALQRIGEDSICIIDGDSKTQVDDISYAGGNNGMRRVSKVYAGQNVYGEVELQQIHRSHIAKIAENL